MSSIRHANGAQSPSLAKLDLDFDVHLVQPGHPSELPLLTCNFHHEKLNGKPLLIHCNFAKYVELESVLCWHLAGNYSSGFDVERSTLQCIYAVLTAIVCV